MKEKLRGNAFALRGVRRSTGYVLTFLVPVFVQMNNPTRGSLVLLVSHAAPNIKWAKAGVCELELAQA